MIRKLRDLLIIALLSVVALVVVEALVRWLAPQDKHTVYLSQGTLGTEDADTGHLLTPGFHTRTTTAEFTVEYRINEDGWRDERTYDPEPPPGRTRILLLGDSFAYGEATDYDAIWPVRLEQLWRERGYDVEIVKAGVPGFDTRKEAKLLERLLTRYRPHGVLVAFVANDLFTNKPITDESSTHPPVDETSTVATLDDPGEETAPDETANDPETAPDEPVEASAPVAADVITVEHERKRQRGLHVVRWLQRLAIRSDTVYRTVYERTGRARYFAVPPEPAVASSLDLTAELFERMITSCRRASIPEAEPSDPMIATSLTENATTPRLGCDLAVVSLPQLYQVLTVAADDSTEGIDPHHVDATLDERVDAPWIALLDPLADRYRGEGEDLYHRYDGHFTVAGNTATAELLAERLTSWLERIAP